ncbi:YchJ family protein [Actinoplanes sp. NPDC049599]|jgi:SEC-C motif-containing protein|uniref:YchJ family protein n=1 Tax=Actinoplanes sp. NPDC049599 TaxID=3363903 RepID=UPI00378FB845
MARRAPRRTETVTGFDDAKVCPCGLGQPYGECCGPAHRGHAPATAVGLMRSRYTAFTLDDAAYVLRSWHPDTRPADVEPDAGLRWTRLDVLDTTGGGLFDAEGVVEFRAHYRDAGRPGVMHERSRFVRHDGQWVYWGPVLTDEALANI